MARRYYRVRPPAPRPDRFNRWEDLTQRWAVRLLIPVLLWLLFSVVSGIRGAA